MLRTLRCNLRGHEIDRERVWDDGFNHRTTCTRCDRPLLRLNRVWQVFEPQRDGDPRRKAHPRDSS